MAIAGRAAAQASRKLRRRSWAKRCMSVFWSCAGREASRLSMGNFGAHMEVTSVNDGPVTLLLDTDQLMEARRSS